METFNRKIFLPFPSEVVNNLRVEGDGPGGEVDPAHHGADQLHRVGLHHYHTNKGIADAENTNVLLHTHNEKTSILMQTDKHVTKSLKENSNANMN